MGADLMTSHSVCESISRRNFTSLQERLQTIEQTNKNLTEENLSQKSKIEELEETVTKMNGEKEQIQSTFQRKLDVRRKRDDVVDLRRKTIFLQVLQADIAVERETYQKSRAGLDQIYHELQKKYEDERSSKEVNHLVDLLL